MKRHCLVLIVAALAVVAVDAPAVAQKPSPCPAAFHVLHDDRVGDLQLPEGAYQLTPSELSCERAAQLFAEFLQDYNGVLPRPWRYAVEGAGQGSFSRGTGGAQFQVVRTGDITPATPPGPPSDGGGTHGSLVCPATFTVQHNDRVGALRLPRGDYRVTRLGARISCARTTRLFRRFLQRPSGRLFGNWIVLPAAGEFVKGSSHYGFQVERVED
jgi:hypothetical protein